MKKILFLFLVSPCLLWGQLPTRKEMREVKQVNRELLFKKQIKNPAKMRAGLKSQIITPLLT